MEENNIWWMTQDNFTAFDSEGNEIEKVKCSVCGKLASVFLSSEEEVLELCYDCAFKEKKISYLPLEKWAKPYIMDDTWVVNLRLTPEGDEDEKASKESQGHEESKGTPQGGRQDVQARGQGRQEAYQEDR